MDEHPTAKYPKYCRFGTGTRAPIHNAEILKFFTGVCIGTPNHVRCFKNGRNRKSRVGVVRKQNTSWRTLAEPLGAISPELLCDISLWSLMYSPHFAYIG